ncbi:MAG: type III-B CRISPR module RAMP protein Cmr6, partial [Ruminococcus sp.]
DEKQKMGFSFDYVTGQPYIPGSSVKGVLRSHFKNHPEAVAEILNSNGKYCVSKEDVGNLEKLIFDNSDVFLDAVVYDGSKNKKLIGFDYITPHKEVTQNPNPIKIIKVLPDVCFEFRFVLSDKEINGRIFPAGKLRCLFCELLCIFGAGAKTNAGYGNFVKEEERVKCPHCNTGNFRYTQKGAERKNCFKCGKPLK